LHLLYKSRRLCNSLPGKVWLEYPGHAGRGIALESQGGDRAAPPEGRHRRSAGKDLRWAGVQSLSSRAHLLRIRASLRSTVLVMQPSRAAISALVYPSSFQVATLRKVESRSCSISR
jgi:hypothetical protein